MNERKCPHCNTELPEEAFWCMHCGKYIVKLYNPNIETGKSKTHNAKKGVFLVISAAVVLLTAFTVFAQNELNESKPLSSDASSQSSEATDGAFVVYSSTHKEASTADTEAQSSKSTSQAKTEAETHTEKETEASSKTEKDTSTEEKTTKEKSTAKTTKKEKTTEKTTVKTTKESVRISENTIVSYPSSLTDEAYEIPSGVTSISAGAFNNKHLKELRFNSREEFDCDFQSLFAGLENLERIYIYPGTPVDLYGKEYFDGEIIYI